MSEKFYEDLESLIGKHRAEEADQKRDEETEARFQRIEEGITSIGNLIQERIPDKPPAAANSEASAGDREEGNPSGNTADPPPPDPELNIETVSRFSVPRIYQGDDEPEIVQYIDASDGETKTRKGRRKNYPTQINVESAMAEPEGRPQEPEVAEG